MKLTIIELRACAGLGYAQEMAVIIAIAATGGEFLVRWQA